MPKQSLGDHDQPLLQELRRMLRSGDPLDLLAMVSAFLEVTDPRSANPLESAGREGLGRGDLIDSFIGTPTAETTAALTAMRVLIPDERTRARIGCELGLRSDPIPDWLTALAHATIEPDVWFLTHILGDGDDYLFGVSLPSGQALSALVYVDHNLGTVVKDAFVVSEELEDLAIKVGVSLDDPDQSLTRTDAATARAVVSQAIERGSRMHSPPASDSWPRCRPLVEWMLRQLPAGGVAPRRKVWSAREISAIAAEFFASPFGAPFDDDDGRSLVESVLWFGSGYATGDPFRWSAVTVELLLADWAPRSIVAEPSILAKLPDLLRAYILYCHQRMGIRLALSEETLAAVDHYEPEYRRLIQTVRPPDPAGDFDEDENPFTEDLERVVGGPAQLQDLDTEPLPDEPFEWADISDDIRPVVQETLAVCDRCADQLLDVEHRTAMRRFLRRAAVGDPAVFRRKASPVRGAAAVAWVVARANDTVGPYGCGMTAQDLLAWFGVSGGISQRARPLLRAIGADPNRYGTVELGAPDLLTSTRRIDIIAVRDGLAEL